MQRFEGLKRKKARRGKNLRKHLKFGEQTLQGRVMARATRKNAGLTQHRLLHYAKPHDHKSPISFLWGSRLRYGCKVKGSWQGDPGWTGEPAPAPVPLNPAHVAELQRSVCHSRLLTGVGEFQPTGFSTVQTPKPHSKSDQPGPLIQTH